MSAGELCLTSLKQAVEKATFFTSDSRLTDDCTIFVALSGSNVDGHDFVHDALNKDVVACITQKDVGIEDPRIIKCEDTSKAHRLLAKLFREKFQGKVIAVGGSNGKTSTKDFLYTLLAKKFSVIKTLHSQNGYLGIPATFERLRPGLDCAVIEVGIDGPGDMQSHLDIVKPDIGILTSIGTEHLRQLKNLEGVFEEESKLVEFCASNGGPSFVPANDPFLSKLSKQKNVTLCPDDPLEIDSRFHLEQIQGIARRNASLAITCALKVGMSLDEILTQLPSLKLPEGRGALNRVSGQEYVVEDFYNANLSSMTAATTQAAIKAKDLNLPLYFVLGDMLDLG
ncbi:hypothetical protein GW915_13445, partial [bacterium]|nr:hypothetical protein [bacterium]